MNFFQKNENEIVELGFNQSKKFQNVIALQKQVFVEQKHHFMKKFTLKCERKVKFLLTCDFRAHKIALFEKGGLIL